MKKSKGKESSAPSSSSYRASKTFSATEGTSSHFSSLISILRNSTFIYYTLIPAILLSIITILSLDLDAWNLFELHHFYIELFAVMLGSILAFYYLARAYTLNDNFSRFVGFGFLVAAVIDLLHVIISYVFMDNVVFLKYFIPQTWFAGRIFLSAMLVIAIAKYPTFSGEVKRSDNRPEAGTKGGAKINQEIERSKEQGKVGKSNQEFSNSFTADGVNNSDRTFGIYLIILAVLAGSVAISSLYLVLPYSVIDDVLLHRPYEIPSLVLFIIALILFYKNQLYKKSDVFYKGILAYLIIDIYAQIIMSYSATSFDTPHNVAHILKDAGYFVNIIALALSSIQYNVRLRESNKSLIEGNVRLKEREEVIRVQYDRLKESEKIKDEFINTAAHELRTPIQPILGLTDIVRSRIISPDGSNGRIFRDGDNATKRPEGVLLLLDVIIRNAKRLKQLTDNILDVTKIESHSFKLNKERFNIEQLIEETAEEQNITISDTILTNAEIKILLKVNNKVIEDIADIGTATAFAPAVNAISPTINTPRRGDYKISNNTNANNRANRSANAVLESFWIEADKTKISQVLSNLLSNARSSIRLKAGEGEGRIIISVSRTQKRDRKNKFEVADKIHGWNSSFNSDDEIIVSITDNGQGIPPDVAQKLFTKFVSGSDSGTGLGLYISKNIIEAHGGRIWAMNNDPAAADELAAISSTGATFGFALPVLEIVAKSK
ncbi:MAG: sensor histidine kinase [Nitrososphaeraceae archaeon]